MSGTVLTHDKRCIVCGKSMIGLPISSKCCSEECRKKRQREMDKERYDRAKAKLPRKACKFCGAPVLAPRKQMCPICTELRREKTVEQMQDKKNLGKEIKKAKEKEDAMRRKPSFSAGWTLEELSRMARKHNTSYGKLVAFMDANGRTPREGEMQR